MDGGGRFTGSLIETAPRPRQAAATMMLSARHALRHPQHHHKRPNHAAWLPESAGRWRRYARTLDRLADQTARLPRHGGLVATIILIVASTIYGAEASGQAGKLIAFFKDIRDGAATAVGFPIATVAIDGEKHLSRDEILAAAGVTAHASLLFFDVADARARLLTNPWIAEATVQKLLPNRLVISISERAAFALWQKEGRVGVIAKDGTVLEPYVLAQDVDLPLVVGAGAETRAKEFLAMLDRRPELRADVRASVLVAERRWNLRLKNGVDVRLPEFGVEKALDQLAALEGEVKLSGRDITAIDLRLPDRITVRLSDSAFQAREEAAKKKMQKSKGGSA
jgi:cell division protein FtsQ